MRDCILITLVYAILNEGRLILSHLPTLLVTELITIILSKLMFFFVFFNQKQLKVADSLAQFPWARMEQLIFSIMESGSENFLSGHSSNQCSMYGPFVSSSIVFFSGFIFISGFEVSIRIFFFECMGGDQCISLSYSPSHSYYAAPIFCRKHFFLDQVYFH